MSIRDMRCALVLAYRLSTRFVIICGIAFIGGSQGGCSVSARFSGYDTVIETYRAGGGKLEYWVSISGDGMMSVAWYGTGSKEITTTKRLTLWELRYIWAPLMRVDVFSLQNEYGVTGIHDAGSGTVYLRPANSVESDFTFHLGTKVKTIRAVMGTPQALLGFEQRVVLLSGLRKRMAEEPASV